MRVALADDSALIRDGLSRLLHEVGFEVVGEAADAQELLEIVERERPEVAITDIRMPPTHTDEGLEAAVEIRRRWPDVAVLVLSQYATSSYAVRLLSEGTARVGYLLKEKVAHVDEVASAIRRVAAGESVVDPDVVQRLLAHGRGKRPLDRLTERERDVLALIAEGLSNRAICDRLVVSPKTVGSHVSSIFAKLDLPEKEQDHRRVLAVLTYIRALED